MRAVQCLFYYLVFHLLMALACESRNKELSKFLIILFALAAENSLFRLFVCFFLNLSCRTYDSSVLMCKAFTFLSFFILCSFMKDKHWSSCSVTCGEGIRTKHYRCKIFLEFSRTLAPLHNDSFCFGPKPAPQVERCILEPCSMAYGYEESYPR